MTTWYYPPMKTMSLKLPEDINTRLTGRARALCKTKSELTREALTRMLEDDSTDGVSGASCLDMVRDLVGVASGPRDLASNKKHLRGYGR